MVDYKQLAIPAGFNSDDSDGADTDEELKETFAAGLLKPGLNYEAREKKAVKNNVAAMRQKLAEMQAKPELPWRRSPPSSPTRGTCTARSRPWRPSARRRRPPCWRACLALPASGSAPSGPRTTSHRWPSRTSRAEKIRKLRELKMYGRQVHVE